MERSFSENGNGETSKISLTLEVWEDQGLDGEAGTDSLPSRLSKWAKLGRSRIN